MIIGKTKTGNYRVRVEFDRREQLYTVFVNYYGTWGSSEVEVGLPFEDIVSYPEFLEDPMMAKREAKRFLGDATDFSIEDLLKRNGYDRYGNRRR